MDGSILAVRRPIDLNRSRYSNPRSYGDHRPLWSFTGHTYFFLITNLCGNLPYYAPPKLRQWVGILIYIIQICCRLFPVQLRHRVLKVYFIRVSLTSELNKKMVG